MKNNLFIIFSIIFATLNAQDQYAEKSWQYTPNLGFTSGNIITTIDIDSDNKSEIFYSTSTTGCSILKILDYQNQQYEEVFVSSLIPSEITCIVKADPDGDGTESLYLSDKESNIHVFDLETLTIIDTIHLNFSLIEFAWTASAIPGEMNISGYASNKIVLLDSSGGLLYQKTASSIQDMAMADINADGTEELIVSGYYNSYVLNSLDLTEMWNYLGTFGNVIAINDPDNSGKDLIYGADYYDYITCFDGELHSPLYQMDINAYIQSLYFIDIYSDGTKEMLVGGSSSTEEIRCYNLATQELQWTLEPSNGGGIDGIILSDLDNDIAKELVYICAGGGLLEISNPANQTNEWSGSYFDGRYRFDFEYFDSDNIKDIIVGSQSTNNGYDKGLAKVLNGETGALIFDQPLSPYTTLSFGDLIGTSFLRSGNERYMLYLYETFIQIYSYTTETYIISQNIPGSSSNTAAQLFIPKNSSNPQVLLCRHNGSIAFYDFKDNVLVEKWSTPQNNHIIDDFRLGNFDNDTIYEIALLSDDSLRIFDMNTHLLQTIWAAPSIYTTHAFEIADINQDGVKEALMFGNSYILKSINLQTGVTTSNTINDYNADEIRVMNIDDDPSPELVLLTTYGISVYNNDFILQFRSDTINGGGLSNAEFNMLDIQDFDNDQHMEIIAGTLYGVFIYDVNSVFSDKIMPYIEYTNPPDNADLFGISSPVSIRFSKVISIDNLENNILIHDSSGNSLNFSYSFNQNNRTLTINPNTGTWPLNNLLTITLKYTLTDSNGNPLDGNYNGISDYESDDYQFSFSTAEEADTLGPLIENLTIPEELYQGVPIFLNGIVTDSTGGASTWVNMMEYYLDQPGSFGNGIPIKANDLEYNSVTEAFSYRLSTLNLSYGDHILFIHGKDVMGNWGEWSQYNFHVIEENPADWKSFSQNRLNTGSNIYSSLKFPLVQKYEIEHATNGNEHKVQRAIIIEPYLVYTTFYYNQIKKIFCRDIQTGDIIWYKNFPDASNIFPITYAYGNIYAQVEEGSYQHIMCIKLETGETLWSTDINDQSSYSFGPMVYEDHVIVKTGSLSSSFASFDAFTGALQWKNNVFGDFSYDWLPAIYNDTLYGYTEILSGLNPHSGGTVYSVSDIPYTSTGSHDGFNTIIDSSNKRLILTNHSSLRSISIETNYNYWTQNTGSWEVNYLATPALYDQSIYACVDDKFKEFNLNNGSLIWQYNLFNIQGSSDWQPTLNDNILAFCYGGYLFLFDRQSHQLIQQLPYFGDVSISDHYLVVSGGTSGKMAVFEHDPDAVPITGSLEVLEPISCFGDNDGIIQVITEGGSGDSYNYYWSQENGTQNMTFDTLDAGAYTVTVIDNIGNSNEFSIELTQPAVLNTILNSTPASSGQSNGSVSVTITGGTSPYTYTWEYAPDNNSPVLNNIPTGSYPGTVTDSHGCLEQYTINVDEITGNFDAQTPVVNIFPSPTEGKFTITSLITDSELPIEVLDARGVIIESKILGPGVYINYDLSQYSPGCYFIKIYYNNNWYIEKIILIK